MKSRAPSLILSWIAQIIAIVIMGQTLYFKFNGAPESIVLFTELGMEPEGRMLVGILELVTCILLIIPASVTFGAILGSALMVGAIIGHCTVLGWEGDRFYLGILAVSVLIACSVILYIRRYTVPFLGSALHGDETPHEERY